MNDNFNDIKDKIDNAPEGYVPRECYDSALRRANKLDDICRDIRAENKMFRHMIIKVGEAIQAFNYVIDGANEKGFGKDDKD